MAKKKLFFANWKMSLLPNQAVELAEAMVDKIKPRADQAICLLPSFSALSLVQTVAGKSQLQLGAQDIFWQEHGAYTGEESALTLRELGCSSVLVGHSERRQYCHETDEMVNKKVKTCLEHGLQPIICVGETFEERKDGQKDFIVMQQLEKALSGVKLTKFDRLAVAYEPVWEIGSGQAALPDEVWYTLQVLKQLLLNQYSPEVVRDQIWLLYGGSVDADNILGLFGHPVLEGVLVGGSSLSVDNFNQLIQASS
ncbi:MAG: triose-phosphate isomerase [Candidatus Komeilibacteria bacterium]|nr:triose-phosphate isomerase [Candidatus Komeilibacteria bacterium]